MMKNLFLSFAVFGLMLGVCSDGLAVQENPADSKVQESDQPSTNVVTSDGKIRFSFQDQDWQDVIPWFADQAGYQLQPVDNWPDDTFDLQDPQEYSVVKALDVLNHALRIRNPPFTLIRNGRMLVLVKVGEANFPDELIERVKPEDLDQRGAYETIDCMFDLGELDGGQIYAELETLVSDYNRRKYAVYPSSNQLYARGTGEQLRAMRELIKKAQEIKADNKKDTLIYDLKFQDPVTMVSIVGPQLNIRPGETQSDDGSIAIVAEPFSNRLFVTGTKKARDRFMQLSKIVDTDPAMGNESVELAKPVFRQYVVMGDPKLAFDLLQTALEGRDGVRMQQDETNNAIVVWGRPDDHEIAGMALKVLSENVGSEFEIVSLTKIPAEEAMIILQRSLGQDTMVEDESAKGPRLTADSILQRIYVSGTVQEVAMVRERLRVLDEGWDDPLPPGPRSDVRMIQIAPKDQDRLLPMLETFVESTNRGNSFRVVRPEDRGGLSRRIYRGDFVDPEAALEELAPGERLIFPDQRIPKAKTPDEKDENSRDRRDRGSRERGRDDRRSSLDQLFNQVMLVGVFATGIDANQTLLFQEETDGPATGGSSQDPDYKPAPKVESVPGAEVQFEFKGDYLIIKSKDLDAADDLESMIRNFIGETSESQLPAFFELQHRPVEEMKQILESHFGMADSGGGGGGGGGLIPGIVDNMTGGATSFLDGLLGPDTGSGGAGELEGDVRFNLDGRFNVLMVSGATANDLAEITDMISYFDRPQGDVRPETSGEFRTIDVLHRNAEELVEIIRKQIPDLIKDPEAQKAQAGGQNREAQQLLKAMQAFGGGGKGGGGSTQDIEKMKPKAVVDFDSMTNQILVTGPEFIYDEVYVRVLKLDLAELSEPKQFKMLSPELGKIEKLVPMLQTQFGENKVVMGGLEENQNGNTGSTPKSTSSTPTAAQSPFGNPAAASAMINAMRARAAGGGGQRGGSTRGGSTRGGGGTRGGGRGGR